jgi:hypothetical protein
VTDFSKESIVQEIISLLLRTNQDESYTYYKFMMDKHKEEWPELWHLLSDLMYVAYIEDKFIDPK